MDMLDTSNNRYYLVREDILPEGLLKTMQVKELLSTGKAKTVHEAVEQIGLSRSAFYKYKDGVFSLSRLNREHIVTISLDLEHRTGLLSKVLGLIAGLEGNVLTIHQTIPLQGVANIVISVDTSMMINDVTGLLQALQVQEGVNNVLMVGRG